MSTITYHTVQTRMRTPKCLEELANSIFLKGRSYFCLGYYFVNGQISIMCQNNTSQNLWKTTILSVILPDFDPVL